MLKHSLRANLLQKTQATSPFMASAIRAFAAGQAKIPKSHNLLGFIQQYQRNGHLKAKVDPLGLRL
jgi:2-oxoglutarate dehydrogenase complex dehydrogenase (E1) component-like enzyme